MDGWSSDLLMQELSALYQAQIQSLPDPLPALSIQYGDYAIWQRDYMAGSTGKPKPPIGKANWQAMKTCNSPPTMSGPRSLITEGPITTLALIPAFVSSYASSPNSMAPPYTALV